MSYSQKALGNLLSILKIYFLGIAFFIFFRLLLVFSNFQSVRIIPEHRWLLLSKAMWMGFRFDTVISCYILSLPILVFSVLFLFKRLTRPVLNAGYIYLSVMFPISFMICCVDIPFFNHFFTRLNDTIFNWTGHTAFGFKMIVQEPSYFIFFFVFLLISAAYLYVLWRIRHTQSVYLPSVKDEVPGRKYLLFIPSVLVLLGLTFLGIRGRVEEKSPIIAGTAFFSNYPFINQLGLNPVFTLMRSWLDSKNPENSELHWVDENKALQTMGELLHGDPNLKDVSPIARMQNNTPAFKGRNVVLVIMESMSAAKMDRFGSKDHLTPFLDSLAGQCWSFDSVFSAGMHTYNGIYTNMFAHPALMKKHTMDHVTISRMAGFPNTLKKQGYETIFFTTHDEMFDNMSGFMSSNDVNTVIGQKDYPASEVKSTLGVPDEFMFRFAVPKLDKLASGGKPFFAAFMTASDHDPHIIPTDHGFVPRHKEETLQSIEYADWSLRKFIEYASAQPWYNNTVFVFVADHGAYWGDNAYDVAFSYHHVPFLVFAPGPGGTTPHAYKQLGLQSDVFPTVASRLTEQFVNNTFGIDLLTQKHDYIVFSSDDKLTCMNDSLMYVYREEASPSLYKYRHNDLTDYSSKYQKDAAHMQQIAFSWLQTSQWMIKNRKAEVK
ncbi:LTA synthase family protein [Chitinophagaceae bacterium MMS25-I14]